ncbi:hypothetical protein EJM73_09250 [Clostridium botulinum]|uniref:hypothetical protein n=1 Tax=Clostridium botulinum TaxID=1491 RepID=UPI001375F076|nr:hypothetical protein [Clostridium botulinum]NCI19812.1 hypothetical protein [Clostridium botulinum]NCI35850.1 hypothetical protein [Clostridium botulinum]NCI71707.1 hypothetical protein [Clostridium botulinum]NDI38899.1 hypothetical protein [Clostridium botulinum]
MLANVNILGYTGLVKIIEEDTNGYDIELLEGNLKGKKTYISKNSKTETIEKIKASAKIERKGRIKEYGRYSSNYIYYYITVKSNTLENAEKIHYIITNTIMSKIKELEFVGCPTEENNSYFDSLAIEFDLIEDVEVKELFKTIKKDLGIR